MPRIVLLALLATLVASPVLAQTGNGAPNGPHYNLNIIGVDPEKAKKVDMTDSNRHTIFVALGRKGDGIETKIYLGASEDFVVCDGNGFDAAHDCTNTLVSPANGAVFGLPCNTNLTDPDGTTGGGTLVPCDVNETAAYQVWVRGLGSPKGNPQSTTTTCATDPSDNTLVCSTEHMVLVRERGTRSVFKEYTNELTSILADVDGDGDLDRVSLFAGGLQDWYWSYVNEGLKLAQLRFYWVSI